MNHEFPTASLLIITMLAVMVPFLAARLYRLHVPIIVGELLCGIAVGQSGLDLIAPSPIIDFLAAFGFSYLMFLSGLEVDFSLLHGKRSDAAARQPLLARPLPIAFATFGVTLLVASAVAWALAAAGLISAPLMMALILSTTSLGIVVPVLKERHMLNDAYGQAVLVCALVADFATLLLITIAAATDQDGLSLTPLLALLLIAAFGLVARLGKWALDDARSRHLVNELSHATGQVRVRGSLALMIAFIALAEQLGAELILGAFLAGAVISLLSDRGSHLHLKLDAIGFGFFVPFFFIMVGVRFDLSALLESPSALTLVPLLLLAAYAIKLAAATCLAVHFGARRALAAGFLLSARLSLIVAAATISLELGLIDQATNAAIILVAIVTSTVSPMLFSRCLRAVG